MLFFCSCHVFYALFHHVSTPIALVLFWAAEKGDQHHTTGGADITVSYILLVGALILDVSSATLFLLDYLSILPGQAGWYRSTILRVANKMKLCSKDWSEKIAQYNMIGSGGIPIGMVENLWSRNIISSFEIDNISLSKDLKESILDNLLISGTRKEWNIASSRGKLAIQKWMDSHKDPDSAQAAKALQDSISFDLPTSVLIWHIATDIVCYYHARCRTSSTDSDKSEKKDNKQISMELSNYIMYLVFKCGVTLTTNAQVTHDNARRGISSSLTNQRCLQFIIGEKQPVLLLRTFYLMSEEKAVEKLLDSAVIDIERVKEPINEQENSIVIEIQKYEEEAKNNNVVDAGNHAQELQEWSEMLPRAYLLAQELFSIKDESDRWGLIAAVWAEMLYYIAPRCGTSFHYEHLSTGGEFITHVLLLMYFLGPFMPTPGA